MLNARGANKLSTETLIEKTSLALNYIEWLINEAIKEGQYCIYYDSILTHDQEKILKEFGYEITHGDLENHWCTISWK